MRVNDPCIAASRARAKLCRRTPPFRFTRLVFPLSPALVIGGRASKQMAPRSRNGLLVLPPRSDSARDARGCNEGAVERRLTKQTREFRELLNEFAFSAAGGGSWIDVRPRDARTHQRPSAADCRFSF